MRSVCVAALLSCSLASAGIEFNGSFEASVHETPGRFAIDELHGWTASGGAMFLERGVNDISNIEAHSGDQFVSMGHQGAVGGMLSQTLFTEVGQTYEISFVIRSIEGNAMQALFASVTDNAGGGELGSVTAVDFGFGAGWTAYAFSFVAVSESSTLTLQHVLGSAQANLAVDSVSVDIPAPGALAVLGLGLLARRRR